MTLLLTVNSNALRRDLKSSLLLQARLARHQLRRMRASQRYSSGSLEATPVLFANSFPKSGTHLLTQVLKGFTKIGPAVDSGLVRGGLQRLPPHHGLQGHLDAQGDPG